MKLSLDLLAYELDMPCKEKNFYDAGEVFCIEKIRFYQEKEAYENGCLYLFPESPDKSSMLLEDFPGDSAAVFFAKSEIQQEKQIPYLCFDCVSVYEVYNRLTDIFQKYAGWQWELQQALDEESLQKMADCSVSVFRNGVNIFDADYHQTVEEELWDYPHGDIPKDTINFFKSDRLFNEVRYKTEAFAYPPSILPVTSWCKNIYYHKEYYCRIVVRENEPCPPQIEKLLDFFAGYVEKYVVNLNRLAPNHYELHLGDYLKKAVLEEEFSLEKFKQCLLGYSWYPNHHYRMAYLLLSKGDYHNKTADYYCRQFMREYPAMCAFTMEDHIVFVLNCQPYHDSITEFMATFSYMIREGNFRVGFSNLFQGFVNLKYYYRQAQIAVLSGLQSDETIWCHYFSEQAMSYILQEASRNLPPEYLCAQELLVLREYDKKNNADYFHTLKTYLDLNRNAVQAAKALYIHHATMVYRLKRLKELVQIDFGDNHQMLYLQLSFRLLERDQHN